MLIAKIEIRSIICSGRLEGLDSLDLPLLAACRFADDRDLFRTCVTHWLPHLRVQQRIICSEDPQKKALRVNRNNRISDGEKRS